MAPTGHNGDDDDYRRKREKNNLAVKKSRVKHRQRTQETLSRVSVLKAENRKLEENINVLTKELSFLKDLFLAHAGTSHGVELDMSSLEAILKDDEDQTPEGGDGR